MRIDLYGSPATAEAIEQASKVSADQTLRAQKQSTAQKAATEDKTTLSSENYSVDSLTKAALQPIPSREARVESLKLAVRTAQYELNSAQIAQSLASSDF